MDHMSKKKAKTTTKLEALNPKQEKLISAIKLNDMIIAEGSAGTGKTFIVATLAAEMLKDNTFKQIIFTRPVVPCGKSVGYLPGSLEEKMAAWTMPFMNIIKQHFSTGELDMFLKNGKIQAIPFEVMRGSSFDDSFVIMDEAQNATKHEMKMFLTRIGMYSKLLVLGDPLQSDLYGSEETGLDMAKRIIDEQGMNVPVISFDSDDCVRSGLCKDWLKAFEKDKDLPRFLTESLR